MENNTQRYEYDVYNASSFKALHHNAQIPDFMIREMTEVTPDSVKRSIELLFFGGTQITELPDRQVADCLVINAVIGIQKTIMEQEGAPDWKGFMGLNSMPEDYLRVFKAIDAYGFAGAGDMLEQENNDDIDISEFGGRYSLN